MKVICLFTNLNQGKTSALHYMRMENILTKSNPSHRSFKGQKKHAESQIWDYFMSASLC